MISMGHDVISSDKERRCHCYLIPKEESEGKLLCYSVGVIGTLTDEQVSDLCTREPDELKESALPPTDEMEKSYSSFTSALESAADEYDEYRETHTPDVKEWYKILSRHMEEI